MKHTSTIVISKSTADVINRYLTVEPASEWECLSPDIAIGNTAKFDDGKEVDVKCCGVEYREGEYNLAWCEAVLFDEHGCELCFSDVEEEYTGEWTLEYNGDSYVVTVVAE